MRFGPPKGESPIDPDGVELGGKVEAEWVE